jgi:hypothetical protein
MTAHTKPTKLDWADELATDIIGNAHALPFTTARKEIAGALRALAIMSRDTAVDMLRGNYSYDLARETQLDHDEEREGTYR